MKLPLFTSLWFIGERMEMGKFCDMKFVSLDGERRDRMTKIARNLLFNQR